MRGFFLPHGLAFWYMVGAWEPIERSSVYRRLLFRCAIALSSQNVDNGVFNSCVDRSPRARVI